MSERCTVRCACQRQSLWPGVEMLGEVPHAEVSPLETSSTKAAGHTSAPASIATRRTLAIPAIHNNCGDLAAISKAFLSRQMLQMQPLPTTTVNNDAKLSTTPAKSMTCARRVAKHERALCLLNLRPPQYLGTSHAPEIWVIILRACASYVI